MGLRGGEVTGEWRKLHNEEFNDLYSSHNIVRVIKSRRMKWAGYVARMRDRIGAHRVLVGRPERRRPLGRPRRRPEIMLKYMLMWNGTWTGLAQDWKRWRAFVNEIMKFRVS